MHLLMDVYVIEEGDDIASTAYRTFGQAKEYITAKSTEKDWVIVDNSDEPEPDFEEDNVNRYSARRKRSAERPIGKTYIWARGDDGEIPIIIHKLTLKEDPSGGRRRRASSGTRRKGKTLKQRLAAAKKKCFPG